MLKTLVSLCILLIIACFRIYPQTGMDRKLFKDKFHEAEYFFLRGDFREAAFLYNELLKADPANPNLQFLIGASYLSVEGMKERAVPFLEHAVGYVSPGYREGSYREKNAPREAFFALARAYHIEYRFSEALDFYGKYKNVMPLYDAAEIDYVSSRISSVALARTMIMDTLKIALNDAGDRVNQSASTSRAVFAVKDSILVYMSEKPFYSAIMMTRRRDEKWENPVNITGQLEVDGDYSITGISSDGTQLFLVKQGEQDKDLYISYFRKARWSPAEKFPEPVNSPWDESHCSISYDNKILCFTSNRPGGTGAMDIYFCERRTDDTWSDPVNPGKPVNSIYSEDTPFLTADGKTLYFSSMGHATMGGYDIFYSTRLPDGSWSVPANLGFPVNTCDDDLFFFPLQNGRQALYSGLKLPGTAGRIEWISFNRDSPERVFTLDGALLADDNLEVGPSTEVKIIDGISGDTVARVKPDPTTGKYTTQLNAGSYNIVISSNHYTDEKLNLDLKPEVGGENLPVSSHLQPEEVTSGEYLIIKNILFGFDSSDINYAARLELEKLRAALTLYPDLYLQVRGHTDSRGSSSYNLALSRKRARSVVDYLVTGNISRERFISSGIGEAGNLARNENPDGSDNPEGRKFNRQVEILLINNHYDNINMSGLSVPESLRPMREKQYYIILEKTRERLKVFPAEIPGQKIRQFETENGVLYTLGPFNLKNEATGYLNDIIDGDFPGAFLVEEHDFRRMLSYSDISPREVRGPFTIQILALKNRSESPILEKPGDIQLFEGKDGYHRYVTGIYESYENARLESERFIAQGYTDAFVMPLSRYTPSAGDLEKTDPGYYFTVQITATKNRPDPAVYRQLEGVRITREEDGFYKVSEGIFTDRTRAEKALEEVRKSGFADAFIRKIQRTR